MQRSKSVTNRPTDQPTDRVTYRVACTRLKTSIQGSLDNAENVKRHPIYLELRSTMPTVFAVMSSSHHISSLSNPFPCRSDRQPGSGFQLHSPRDNSWGLPIPGHWRLLHRHFLSTGTSSLQRLPHARFALFPPSIKAS